MTSPQDAVDPLAPKGSHRHKIATAISVGVAFCLVLAAAEISRRAREAQIFIAARNSIREQIAAVLASPDVLRMAAKQLDISPGNLELAACLIGPGSCTATDPENQVAFGLRTALVGDAPLAVGTDLNPSKYSKKGKMGCNKDEDPDCPGWTVKAWFWAECNAGQTSCGLARRIHVRYQVLPVGELGYLTADPPSEILERDPYAFVRTVDVERF